MNQGLLSNLSPAQRETLVKLLPYGLVLGIAWLAARGVRKFAWSMFGLYWAIHWMHPWRLFH
ncbi:MAG: hypothetical protein ACTHK2_07240 [Dokdonella sp.]|uniref:hypothetical protein n=1 Tax=Dokdonella sp. TaxID=2291710 RepID=UPI003F812543